jgi:asparagine N-glycosylation enzyme membrane subunit Stt3
MTFDVAAWAWPQWTVFILMLVALAAGSVLHGKDKDGRHNAFVTWFTAALYLFLLTAGGFYG